MSDAILPSNDSARSPGEATIIPVMFGDPYSLHNLQIDAWSENPKGEGFYPPTRDEWTSIAQDVAFGFAVCCKAKERLAEIWRDPEGEEMFQLLADRVAIAKDNLEKCAVMLGVAQSRLLMVGNAVGAISLPP